MIANHTPVTCKNLGSTKRKTIINPKVRRKDMGAETFPSFFLSKQYSKKEELFCRILYNDKEERGAKRGVE